MNTKDKGELSEAKVTARLKEKGLPVLKPVGDNQKYDLVYEQDRLVKVQVKTAKKIDKIVRSKLTTSVSNRNENRTKKYSEEEIDEFMLYSPETDEVYRVPVEEAPSTEITIRLAEPKKQGKTPQINWREDYLF